MSNTQVQKRLQQLVLLDTKRVLEVKQFAKRCHQALQDFDRLKPDIQQHNAQIEDRLAQFKCNDASIESLRKSSSEINVELIRLKQSMKRLRKYADKTPELGLNDDAGHSGDQPLMNKIMKLQLLLRCTGIYLDEIGGPADAGQPSANGPPRLEGLAIGETELEAFGVSLAADMQAELWTRVAEQSPHLSQLTQLFADAEVVA